MKAMVSILYDNGIPVPMFKTPVTVEAEVDVAPGKHPVTGRLSMTAWTTEPSTSTTGHVRPLHDVALVWIAAMGIRIRGTEQKEGGREVAQEWFIVPLQDFRTERAASTPQLPGMGMDQNAG